MLPHERKTTDSVQSCRNTGWKCYVRTIIVKWPETEEETKVKRWSQGTLHETSGQKIWNDIW